VTNKEFFRASGGVEAVYLYLVRVRERVLFIAVAD